MPTVLSDNGATVTVMFPDGSQHEVEKGAYERAFPGGQYQAGVDPNEALGAAQAPAGPLAGAPETQPLALPKAPEFGMPKPTGAFKIGGLSPEPAFGGPSAPGLGADTALTPPEAPPEPGPTPALDPERGADFQTLPAYNQGVRDNTTFRKGVATDTGDIESQELASVAGALDAHNQAAQQIEVDRQKADSEGRAAAKAKLADVDATVKKFEGATVDRGRLWKNMSTGSKILAAIGLGLSAIGQAKSRQGGPNPALQIILGAMEDDVADQRADSMKLGESAEKKRGLYNEFLKQHGNDMASYDLALAMSAAQAKRQIDVIGAQSGSEKVKLAAQDMAAQIDAYGLDKLESARQRYGEETYRTAQMRLQELKQAGRGVGGAGKAKPVLASSIDDLATKLGVKDRADRERIVVVDPARNEGFLAMGGKDQAEALNKRLGAVDQFAETAARLIRSVKKNGWEPTNERWKSKEGGEMLSDYGQLIMLSKDMNELGAISGPDLELVQKMLGGEPGKWRAADGDLAQLERTARGAISRLDRDLNRAGYGKKYAPAFVTEAKAKSTDFRDRTLELEAAARDVAESNSDNSDEAREAFFKTLEGVVSGANERHAAGNAYMQGEAVKQAKILRGLPPEMRKAPKIEEALNLLDKAGNPNEKRATAKDIKADDEERDTSSYRSNLGGGTGAGRAQ